MKISTLDLSVIDKAINLIHNRKLVLWGAGWHVASFIRNYCGEGRILPRPYGVTDSTRSLPGTAIEGVPIIGFPELKEMSPDETAIIMTAGLLDLTAQVIPNELYYFPIYHRRSFEAYQYINEHSDLCDTAIALLADDTSKFIYRKRVDNLLTGGIWDQTLYEGNAYFGNDLINDIPNNGHFLFAGAFNGKHIDRALKCNSTVDIIALEPSRLWFFKLIKKYHANPNVVIHNNLLWHEVTALPFEEDESNFGLTAHVATNPDLPHSYRVTTATIDTLAEHAKIAHIALDIEGSEQNALQGAKNTISRDMPSMCLCLYHTLDDYFNLPILVHESSAGKYRQFVKQHSCISAIETVLYAI